jgi:hypothetical protein
MKERELYLALGKTMVQCTVEYEEDECGVIVYNVYGMYRNCMCKLNIKLLYIAQDILNQEWEASRPPIT